jgi:hypothetical protein
MPVSRKNKSLRKSSKSSKRSKNIRKTRKRIRKMRGGSYEIGNKFVANKKGTIKGTPVYKTYKIIASDIDSQNRPIYTLSNGENGIDSSGTLKLNVTEDYINQNFVSAEGFVCPEGFRVVDNSDY